MDGGGKSSQTLFNGEESRPELMVPDASEDGEVEYCQRAVRAPEGEVDESGERAEGYGMIIFHGTRAVAD